MQAFLERSLEKYNDEASSLLPHNYDDGESLANLVVRNYRMVL